MAYRTVSLAEFTVRFWSTVNKGAADECWDWGGSLRGNGYGAIVFRRKADGAHRVAWELARGPIPPGLLVCHHCDNPACCNPNHLFLGTHRDNIMDCLKKGRRSRVGRPPAPCLPLSLGLKAKEMLDSGMTTRAVANALCMGKSSVWLIKSGKWSGFSPGAVHTDADAPPHYNRCMLGVRVGKRVPKPE